MDRKLIPLRDTSTPGSNNTPPSNVSSADAQNASAPQDLPPAYSTSASGPSQAASQSTRNIPIPSFPAIDYSLYRPPESTLSPDQTTITTTHRPYSKSASDLAAFIRQQASLPPKPYLRITGTSNSSSTPDFDLKLNLLPYLYRAPPADSWNYLTISPSTNPSGVDNPRPSALRRISGAPSSARSLESWARTYVSEPSSMKRISLARTMSNFDLDGLSGSVRNYFADALRYRGHLDISLQAAYARVVVDNQPSKGAGAFFRPLVAALVGAKEFEVVCAVWPFARSASGDGAGGGGGGGGERECAVCSEAAWWREWREAVGWAAVQRRRGWVSVEDRLECAMSGWVGEGRVTEWGSWDVEGTGQRY